MAILNHPPKKASGKFMNGFVGAKPGQYSTVVLFNVGCKPEQSKFVKSGGKWTTCMVVVLIAVNAMLN